MNGEMTCYYNDGKYRHENVKGVMFVNGKLIITYNDECGDVKIIEYTRESLQDGNVLTIY